MSNISPLQNDSNLNFWAVVLAAGEGKRLSGLTSAIYGRPLAKQFAVLDGKRSLLQHTLDRIVNIVPRRRTLVIVAEHQLSIAREQLESEPEIEIVTQPKNLDTAPGVLLPLTKIYKRDPNARIAFLPSDHYISNPAVFVNSLRAADAAVRSHPEYITMLGVAADRAETEYGWIRPGAPLTQLKLRSTGARRIVEFIEKPDYTTAQELYHSGCLWNTFSFVASAPSLWNLFVTSLPGHARAFADYSRTLGTTREPQALQRIYQQLPAANCSKDVFEKAANLAVVPLIKSGWSDWGSPHRVFESLAGTRAGLELEERMLPRGPGVYRVLASTT
ncbi:MAG: sugar phosphate nucleotidyltransferase [Planctomycetota bacterium]